MEFTQSVFSVILALGVILVPAMGQEFRSESQGMIVMQGSDMTLFCKVGNLGAKNVIWTHDIAVLSMNHMIIGGDTKRLSIKGKYNLHIKNVSLSDEGRYVCQVTSSPPITQESFINVTVPSKVEMVNKTVNIETTLNKNITLKCEATGKPQPNITWSREDASLPNGKKQWEGDTLSLTNLEYDHGGIYRCTAFNGVGEPDDDSIRINIFYKPRIHTKAKMVHTGPGIRTKVPCIVSGQPRPTVEWRHNNTVLNLRNLPQHKTLLVVEKGFKVDYSLDIRGVRDDDLGSYTCTVSNEKGTDSADIVVTALPSKVKITSQPEGNFSTVYDVTWMVTSAVLPKTYKLMIREVNETHEEEWGEMDIEAEPKEGVTEHAQSYSLTDLTPDTEYEVVIRAYNSYGWGEASNTFTFSTNALSVTIRRIVLMNAVQDSTFDTLTQASHAIDGNTDGSYYHSSCSHTFDETSQNWWQTELSFEALVTRVTLYNRGDCCGEALSNFKIEGFVEDPQTNTDQVANLCSNHPLTVPTGESETIDCDTPIPARFIRITKNVHGQHISFCEVLVDVIAEDLRLEIVEAEQDSTHSDNAKASNAIDGNTDTNFDHYSCTHTEIISDKHWWQGKLLLQALVIRVTLFNRGDCCGERLSNFKIEGFEEDPQTNTNQVAHLCSNHPSAVPTGEAKTIVCDAPTPARYIRITQNENTLALSLCEVLVDGLMAETALQSSSFLLIQHGAWRALDKDPGTCSHTKFEIDSDPWWQVDLGQMETVTGITITNRNDNKYTWLQNFEVVVYESLPTDCVGVEVKKETCAIHVSGVSIGQTVTLTCDTPVTGQYVRITKTKIPGEALSLCEVVVEVQK